MTQRYFGFYWTLPVPWVGFTSLPDNVDEAEAASRTIRYSRQSVKAFVKEQGGTLVSGGEKACMELSPDRVSREFADEFESFLDRAEREGARVAVVDFAGRRGGRAHQYLSRLYDHPLCDVIPIDHEAVHHAGMNPFMHFAEWRLRTQEKIAGKKHHREQVLATLDEMEGGTLSGRANALNGMGLRTHGGKPWTADNLRKFLKVIDA